jgi:hypothetical protein
MKAKRFAEMRKVSLISLGAIAGAGLTLLATHPSAVSVGSSDLLNEPKPAREIDHGEDHKDQSSKVLAFFLSATASSSVSVV